MMGLLLVASVFAIGSWFAWLYFVSPQSDQERIKADQGGTDARVVDVERIGTRHDRAELTWVADHPTPRNGGKWFRVYKVTVAKPSGIVDTYEVGVEARLFGLPDLIRIEWRS